MLPPRLHVPWSHVATPSWQMTSHPVLVSLAQARAVRLQLPAAYAGPGHAKWRPREGVVRRVTPSARTNAETASRDRKARSITSLPITPSRYIEIFDGTCRPRGGSLCSLI